LTYVVRLRQPELVTTATLGMISLRPFQANEDPRQVLILGPEIPENRFVSVGMASPLQLEIVHEAFDTQNYFCRDGTVSWYQMMRFAEPLTEKSPNREVIFDAWKELCITRNHSVIELFHPREYRSSECRSYDKWSKCWTNECLNLVKELWACESDQERKCPQEFAKTLHQVKHPLRTLETLNATICPHPALKDSFFKVVRGLFPNRDWSTLPCLDAMAWYTVDFHQTLIRLQDSGMVDASFQIETTSPCEVAALAGFSDESEVLYPPNIAKVARLCRDDDVDTGNPDALSSGTFQKVKEKNEGKVHGLAQVSMNDFNDKRLAKGFKSLIEALGYSEGGSEFSKVM